MLLSIANGAITMTKSNGDTAVINLNSDTTAEIIRVPAQARAAVGTGPSMVPLYVAATNTWEPQQVTTTYNYKVRVNLSDNRWQDFEMGEQTGAGSTWVNTQAGANIAVGDIENAIPNT